VFSFLSEGKSLALWWASKATAEPQAGGKLHFIWDGDRIKTGDAIFRQFEPPCKLVIEWTHSDGEPILCDGGDPRGMHWPALNIYELWQLNGKTTRVQLHDMGISPDAKYAGTYQAARQGWVDALMRLKRVVESQHRQELARLMRKREQQLQGEHQEKGPSAKDPVDQ